MPGNQERKVRISRTPVVKEPEVWEDLMNHLDKYHGRKLDPTSEMSYLRQLHFDLHRLIVSSPRRLHIH